MPRAARVGSASPDGGGVEDVAGDRAARLERAARDRAARMERAAYDHADRVGRAARQRADGAVRDRAARVGRPALDRAQVVDAAIALVEREGFGALSMRRVAGDLGVGTMSLYWYVATKDDLVDLMLDRAMDEQILAEVPDHWRAGLEQIAYGMRRVFSLHPWVLDAGPRPRLGSRSLEHVEQSIAVTESMGLPFARRMAAVSAVDDYVLGHVVGRHVRPRGVPELTTEAADRLAAGAYPRYRAALEEGGGPDDWWDDATEFAVGLALLLDGVALSVERATATPRRRGRAAG